ncbi:PH domain-containing protein [Micromonospora marina]|uniref:PH domain-containing protein n=1 Tax=Micromonospora marina TaxID=307120 RepID=UPI003D74FBCA
MTVWRRPYSLDLATAGAIFAVVVMVGLSAFLVIAAGSGMMPGTEAVLFGVWLVPGLLVTVRRAMLGVWVSHIGVRSRSLFHTTTVPWASVVEIRNGTGSMAGLDMGRVAIVIERTEGEPVQTPIQRGDFLRPFTFRPELGRLATWPEHYDEILSALRECHRNARPAGRHEPTSPVPDPVRADRPDQPDQVRRPARNAAQRRDIHALTRQYERGALTDAKYAAELARLRGDG